MRKSKIITVDDRKITVRELIVEEVTNIMDAQGEQKISAFDLLLPDRLPADAVCLATGLTTEQMSKMSPSELDEIWQAAEEVNPFFVRMVGRLATLGAAALAAGDLSAMTSKPPAAS
jgi:hypothetical protein